MSGTRAVRLDREMLYAFLLTDREVLRLRVSADECDRLDLFAGKQLRMAIEDGGQYPALVLAVRREPPFAWVAVEFPAVRRSG